MFQCPRCHKSDLAILCITRKTAFVNAQEEVIGGSETDLEYEWDNRSEAHCASPGCTWVGKVLDLKTKVTCTPYTGSFTPKQQENLLDLLWEYLPKVPGKDQVETGFGTKTKTGLLKSIEAITNPTPEPRRRK